VVIQPRKIVTKSISCYRVAFFKISLFFMGEGFMIHNRLIILALLTAFYAMAIPSISEAG
jgi:hypothetical protein